MLLQNDVPGPPRKCGSGVNVGVAPPVQQPSTRLAGLFLTTFTASGSSEVSATTRPTHASIWVRAWLETNADLGPSPPLHITWLSVCPFACRSRSRVEKC